MSGNRNICFAYFLTFSLLIHLLLLAMPFSFKADKQKEIMEVFYLTGREGGEKPGGNNLQQKQQMRKTSGTISREQSASHVPFSPRLSDDLRKKQIRDKTTAVDAVVSHRTAKADNADERVAVTGKIEQAVPNVDPKTTPVIDGGLSSESSELGAAFSSASGVGKGQNSTGLEGSESALYADFGATDGPRFLHRELPEYPFVSKKRGEEGTALLKLQIDETGNLLNAEVIKATNAAFAEAALRAMKKSTFQPAQKNGKPVTSRAFLPVRFRLDQ